VPNAHYENLSDLPSRYGHAIHDLAREVAIAIRQTYCCDGTSLRQHNEPAGNQDRWHYHMHVFPRYAGDDLYFTHPEQDFTPAEQRLLIADACTTSQARLTCVCRPVRAPPPFGWFPMFVSFGPT
jgi:histidine triad (HIT) family protein